MDGFSCPLSPNDDPKQAWVRVEGFYVCSWCNSLRPDEAMALARSGWKVSRYGDNGEYRIAVNMETQNNYSPKIIHVEHYEDDHFCQILEECHGGTWQRKGDSFVRRRPET